MSRVFRTDDPGNSFRRTDAPAAKQGGLFKTDTDDNQNTFTDGQGNKYWFADTTSGDVTVTLPNAADVTPDTIYTIKRVSGGANNLFVTTGGGLVDGQVTQNIISQYACYSYISDGENYWVSGVGSGEGSVSISAMITTRLATYITSASVSTAIANFITSNSASVMITSRLTPYLTSASVATAVTTTTLTVGGGAAVSATASVGALTVAGAAWGRPGVERLGTATTTGLAGVIKVSGTWSSYHTIDIHYQGKGAATTTNVIVHLYTDGGTTPFMTYPLAAVASATASDVVAQVTVYNANISAPKVAVPQFQYFAGVTTQATQTSSATATTGAINCIGICTGAAGVTTTQSAANVYVYGWRT